MKRTFPANIDGQIFYIDEDAFNLLNNYLDQLRQTFHGPEGFEIVGDIESRIRELFSERISSGARVICIMDVNNVIATMGRPEDLGDDPEEQGSEDNNGQTQNARSFVSFNLPGHKKLYRNMKDKVFGGVFGGLASYLNWNANIMRLLFVIILIFSLSCKLFFPLVFLYLIAWMIIPAATTPQQKLAMNGQPINIDTVGQAVIANEPTRENSNFFATICDIIGKLIMASMGLIAGCIVISCLVAIIVLIAGLIALLFADLPMHQELIFGQPIFLGWQLMLGAIFGGLGILMLFGLMAWGAFSVVFNFRGIPKVATWIIIVVSVMLIIASIILLMVSMSM